MKVEQPNSPASSGGKLLSAFKEALIILIFAFIAAYAINLLRPAGIPLLGFSSEKFIQEQQANIPSISLSEAYDLYRQKKAVFVDARDPFSYDESHIAGAINIYPDEVSLHLPQLRSLLSPEKLVVAYCDGPNCPLSKQTAHALLTQGIPEAKVLVDGWRLWTAAKYPIEKGAK